jgi:DNA-binding MarR family transcriptional regulator
MNEAAKMANPRGAERLMAALRDVSAAEQRHGKAIARRLNMYATDFEALSFVVERCALTTGEVGRKLGLTTGAATGVIDRLAERGFVERVGDPRDRRKVVVRPVAARIRPVSDLFEPIEAALAGLVTSYSQQQIATIAQFLAQAARAEKLERGRA